VTDNGFIFLLSLGATLLGGILAVAHISAHRLNQRRQLRLQREAMAPDFGSIIEPELDLGDVASFADPVANAPHMSVQIRHAETAR
jgi:hypothetical protein